MCPCRPDNALRSELFQPISIQISVDTANDKQEVALIPSNQTSPLRVSD